MWLLALLLATLGVIIAALAIEKSDCPSNLPRDKYLKTFGHKCYYFHLDERKQFSDAKDACYNKGGSLVLVKSKEINNFLHMALQYDFKYERLKDLWIGLTDLQQEGHYKWIDGSNMAYENFAYLQGPHNVIFINSVQDCIAMNPFTGQWHDYRCVSSLFVFNEERPFICEYKARIHEPIPPTFPPTLPSTRKTTKFVPQDTTGAPKIITKKSTRSPNLSTPKTTMPTMPILTTKIVINQQHTNAKTTHNQMTKTTTGTPSKTTCPAIICNLDCGLVGYKTNPVNGCVLCDCGN